MRTRGLDEYRRKRDFGRTAEPSGARPLARRRALSFVIQKHAASRLHYDFRLEMEGVLRSWAVPKGPSLDPADKRLAVQVEDHPIEYGGFEGTIPEDEYGGGTVLLWDRGTWTPEGDPVAAWRKGHIDFALDGDKLHGRWTLVRLRRRDADRRENWLLIKRGDEFVRTRAQGDVLETRPESVATGRDLDAIADGRGNPRGRRKVWSSADDPAHGSAARAGRRLSARERIARLARETARATPKRAAVAGRAGSRPRATGRKSGAARVSAKAPARGGGSSPRGGRSRARRPA